MSDSLENAFLKAAQENLWGDADSVSGPGSNLFQTRIIRQKIPELLEKHGVLNMLDAPCGDLFWMKEILPVLLEKNIQYNGADIVPPLIDKHNTTYQKLGAHFHCIDLTKGPIPKVDLIFTRDCFIHLSYENIFRILMNYKKSGSKYLLVNTYTKPSRRNVDVEGFYLYGRMLNLTKFPFYFPEPLELIVEGCTEGNGEFSDKSLGLWKIEDINLSRIKFHIGINSILRSSRKALRRIKRVIKKSI